MKKSQRKVKTYTNKKQHHPIEFGNDVNGIGKNAREIAAAVCGYRIIYWYTNLFVLQFFLRSLLFFSVFLLLFFFFLLQPK